MATLYDKTDLAFTWNGDYTIGNNGDLADTNYDHIQSLIQDVQSVVDSSLGDWEENPGWAASLEEFVGEPNTRVTAQRIRDRIISSIVFNNIAFAEDLDVRIVPIDIHSVMCLIRIKAQATRNNSLESDIAIISMVFDYSERGIYFVGPPEV